MRNVTEHSWAASGVRHGTRPWAALAAVATVVGVSLSIAASEAVAYEFHLTRSTQTTGGAPLASSPNDGRPPRAQVYTSIAGLDTHKPSLRFAITVGGGVPVTAVTVALPSGLSFSTNAANLAHGVRATGTDKRRSSVRRGQLTVTLKGPSSKVNLTIAGPALSESRGLARSVVTLLQFNQAHTGDERVLPLKLTVTVDSGRLPAVKVPVTIPFR